MRVHVHKRSGKFVATLTLPDTATTEDLKAEFYRKFHYYPERQLFTAQSARGPKLLDGQSLKAAGVADEDSVFFKDLGVQISWRLVFVLEYLGPLLIVPLLWYLSSVFYRQGGFWPAASDTVHRSWPQKLAVGCFLAHFVKREAESLFVHRFSNATMPIQRLPINCAHYWLLAGAGIGYFLCHPLYRSPWENDNVKAYMLVGLMFFFEVMNLRTHIILRDLRPRNTRVRGIPQGSGFQWVSCANYFWETLAWVTFSCLSGCFTAWVFTVVAFAQMAVWAQKKHANYRAQFKTYPRQRRAIIPFVL